MYVILSCATKCYIVLVSNSLYGFYHFLSYIYIFTDADEVQFLTSVLDFFIIDQAEFWCNRILPWSQTDQIHFKWNICT